MVVAIDGPAGAGKSSVARAVADRLGFAYLDSGALYRCVTLAARDQALAPAEAAAAMRVELGKRVRLDGRDVTSLIRSPDVSEAASRVAADAGVRAALLPQQRALLAGGDWVAEGRDIGSRVAPEAEVKVFLTAAPRERARRRAAELGLDPEAVLADLTERDARDTSRAEAPLRAASDAVELDTTTLSLEEVVERVVELVRVRRRR
jgi:cytidylate kinase